MKLELKIRYLTLEEKETIIKNDLNDLTEYLEQDPITSKEDLQEFIEDYIEYEKDHYFSIPEKDRNNLSLEDEVEASILNINELVEHFSYLIEELDPISCTHSMEYGKFCSQCGKQLK